MILRWYWCSARSGEGYGSAGERTPGLTVFQWVRSDTLILCIINIIMHR